jgi:hypothetical protein
MELVGMRCVVALSVWILLKKHSVIPAHLYIFVSKIINF